MVSGRIGSHDPSWFTGRTPQSLRPLVAARLLPEARSGSSLDLLHAIQFGSSDTKVGHPAKSTLQVIVSTYVDNACAAPSNAVGTAVQNK